jgi:predicted enzyme related to lactoylglutathione lyase
MTASATLETPASAAKQAASLATQRSIHTAVWFEIPVRDLARATRFYEQVFQIQFQTDARFPGMAVFPRREANSTTGALIQIHDSGHAQSSHDLCGKPSTDGVVIYLSCDGQIDAFVHRALTAGASLIEEVAQIPAGLGYSAQIRDLDGNRIGLHSTN